MTITQTPAVSRKSPATAPVFDLEQLKRSATERKLTVTVLLGGPSAEREVSLQSGNAVADALESLGHTVHREDISPNSLSALARNVDCVFIALHGAFGEDGRLQQILERRGLRYTGSPPAACALAMDKVAAKQRFVQRGLPTPRYAVAERETVQEAVAAWTLPVVVKPITEGSSVFCQIIRGHQDFKPAVQRVLDKYGRCLIEEFIAGKEITVGILGDCALPPIEIRTRRPFYDYEAKYVDNDTEYLFDIDLPAACLDRIRSLSVDAHRMLGCRDFSRVDWMVDANGNPFLLEANVIPGFTSHSLLPKAAAKAGLSFPLLCQWIVNAALRGGGKAP